MTEDLPRRQWFCITGKGSFISLGTFVKGLEFIFGSISHVTVHNISSVSVRDLMTLKRDSFKICTNSSQIPPTCGAAGWLNFHRIPTFVWLTLQKIILTLLGRHC